MAFLMVNSPKQSQASNQNKGPHLVSRKYDLKLVRQDLKAI